MIKCKVFLSAIAVALAVVVALVFYSASMSKARHRDEMPKKANLVKALGLTDLAIWTEARYTRHPSQADFFTAFQDFPSALEHFPAGSIVSPETLGSTISEPTPADPPD